MSDIAVLADSSKSWRQTWGGGALGAAEVAAEPSAAIGGRVSPADAGARPAAATPAAESRASRRDSFIVGLRADRGSSCGGDHTSPSGPRAVYGQMSRKAHWPQAM